MLTRKSFVFALIILMLSVSLLPSLADANLDKVKKLRDYIQAAKTSAGDVMDYYYAEVGREAADRLEANKWEDKVEKFYPTLQQSSDNYLFYLEWLQAAETARDAAQSRINYASDMLDQIAAQDYHDQNQDAIRFWQAELESARTEYRTQTESITSLTPQVEEAKEDYDAKQSEYDEYYDKYEDYDERARVHLTNMWEAALSIQNYFQDIINLYEDNPEELGPCPDEYRDSRDFWDDRTPLGGDTA